MRLEGVTKSFGRVRVLDALDFEVARGENVAVLGRSGTGKSVLLKLIIGLLRPDEGEVYLWGRPISGLSDRELEPLRRRMGVVFQSGALFDSMSVADNLAFPLREFGDTPESRIREVVAERLEWVGLAGAGEKSPSELSGGMRKRVALARTLTFDPELMLYDEPTTGLDPLTGRRVSALIKNLDRKLHSTAIVVTHDIACAREVASRWCYLSGGRILADGRAEELFQSGEAELREFLADFARDGPSSTAAGRSPAGAAAEGEP